MIKGLGILGLLKLENTTTMLRPLLFHSISFPMSFFTFLTVQSELVVELYSINYISCIEILEQQPSHSPAITFWDLAATLQYMGSIL